MAKTVFQKNQRVWVEAVGAWANVEKIVAIWAKGFDEPVRVTYDVGLGREFFGHELKPEDQAAGLNEDGERWRLLRAKNKWQQPADCAHHPFPGTYPIVVTDPNDWGGWRTPGAEYDRDPHRIERQARLIASTPRLQALARQLIDLVAESPEDAPPAVLELARQAAAIERFVNELPAAAEMPEASEGAVA
ncbi:MAG: hypothetical protein GC145_12095 [Caulobacter sp.]|nr:hypothetical protein [Caulobacter sp.]